MVKHVLLIVIKRNKFIKFFNGNKLFNINSSSNKAVIISILQ